MFKLVSDLLQLRYPRLRQENLFWMRGHPDQRSAEKPKSVAPTVTSMWRHRRNLDVGQEGRKIDGNMIRSRAVVRALCWLAADAMPDGPRKRATFEKNTFFF